MFSPQGQEQKGSKAAIYKRCRSSKWWYGSAYNKGPVFKGLRCFRLHTGETICNWPCEIREFPLLNRYTYRKVASSNTSPLEPNAYFFRLLMKGIFDPYVWWPFDKEIYNKIILCVTNTFFLDFHSIISSPVNKDLQSPWSDISLIDELQVLSVLGANNLFKAKLF